MGNIFEMESHRVISTANQNCFSTPIKHPSRILNGHTISYVLNGSWELKVGNEILKPTKDCVFIQPANIPHIGLKLCPPNTTTMFVHFSCKTKDRYTEEEPSSVPSGCIFIGNLVDASMNPDIKKFLIKTIEEHTKGNGIKSSVYLNLLLCELSEVFDTLQNKYAMQIKKIINQNLNRNLTNKEIAKMLNTGIRTAEMSFQSCFHTTIHSYMLKQKTERAKFCLEYYPNMKIIEISQDLGFYDEYHLSRQFKKETGFSPKEYRKHILITKNIP